MKEIPVLKLQQDDFEVEFEILPAVGETLSTDTKKQEIINGRRTVMAQASANQQTLDALNKEIDRLTNNADRIDYMVAVASGILAGLIDSFWVGKFDFKSGKAWSNKQVNGFVMKVAKSQGYNGERLDGAISFLENRFKIPSDCIWKGKDLGISAKSHHLDDLAHHPTPIGLFFSILTQFTKKGYFQNSEARFFPISIDENGEGLIGADIPSKIFAGTINWFFHLVSDMSGSNKTAGVGMGIPGPIISLIKELSAIPGFNKTGLAQKAKDAFVGGRFDFRSELAVGHQLARQAVPVVLNEVIVRSFYFIRRLTKEVQEKKDFSKIEWKSTLPWKNRTVVRMLTIATGTFTIVDLADAAIRAGLKSKGAAPIFATELLLRVNFVGVGRFTIAVGTDVYMGAKRSTLRNKRMGLYSQQLHLMNAMVFYSQADAWIAAETTQHTITEAYVMMEKAVCVFQESISDNSEALNRIGEIRLEAKVKNPELINEITREMEF